MTLGEYVRIRGATLSLAATLGINPSMLSRWATGARRVPAERVMAIVSATKGKVRRHDLRPDLWPGKEKAA